MDELRKVVINRPQLGLDKIELCTVEDRKKPVFPTICEGYPQVIHMRKATSSGIHSVAVKRDHRVGVHSLGASPVVTRVGKFLWRGPPGLCPGVLVRSRMPAARARNACGWMLHPERVAHERDNSDRGDAEPPGRRAASRCRRDGVGGAGRPDVSRSVSARCAPAAR